MHISGRNNKNCCIYSRGESLQVCPTHMWAIYAFEASQGPYPRAYPPTQCMCVVGFLFYFLKHLPLLTNMLFPKSILTSCHPSHLSAFSSIPPYRWQDVFLWGLVPVPAALGLLLFAGWHCSCLAGTETPTLSANSLFSIYLWIQVSQMKWNC